MLRNLKKVNIFLFFLIITNVIYSQNDILKDIPNRTVYSLSNGIKIILLPTDKFGEKVYTSVFFDIEPYKEQFTGELYFIATLNGCYVDNKFLLYKNIISTKDALDSILIFIGKLIKKPSYTQIRVNRLKQFLLKNLKYSTADQKAASVCLSKNNPFVLEKNPETISKITPEHLNLIHQQVFNTHNITLIITGNFNVDTVSQLINNKLSIIKNKPVYKINYLPKNLTSAHQIFYIEDHGEPTVYFCYPLYIPYGSKLYPYYFISKYILANYMKAYFNISETYFKKMLLNFNNGIEQGKFNIKVILKNYDFYTFILEAYRKFEKLKIPSNQTFLEAKKNAVNYLTSMLKYPFEINKYMFLSLRNKTEKDYFFNFYTEIQSIDYQSFIREFSKIFIPDTAKIIITGNKSLSICQLYFLASEYRVSLYDNSLHKYSIIKKGFSAHTIIDDYLKTVNAGKKLQKIAIFFDGQYYFKNSDKKFKIKGLILKRSPNYYRYKTIFVKGKDTLLHLLQITDGKQWIDSTSLGSRKLSRRQFYVNLYKSYIFPELYYDSLNYDVSLQCDTLNLKRHIFKIKVETPYNVVYYDFYDMNKKIKLRTEIAVIDSTGAENIVSAVEYADYRIVEKTNIKMPFTIRELNEDYFLILKISKIDPNAKIPKYIFNIAKD